MTNHSLPQISDLLAGGRPADGRTDRAATGGSAPSPASVEQFEAFLRSADRRRDFSPAGQRAAHRADSSERGPAAVPDERGPADRARERPSTADRSPRRGDGPSSNEVDGRAEADKSPVDADDRSIRSEDLEADRADRSDDAAATEDKPDAEDGQDDTGSIDESGSDPAAAVPESDGDGIEADTADPFAHELGPDGGEVAAETHETSASQAGPASETDMAAAEPAAAEPDETSRSEVSGDESDQADSDGRPATPTSPVAAPAAEQTVSNEAVMDESVLDQTAEDSVSVVVDGPSAGNVDQQGDGRDTTDGDGSAPRTAGRSTASEGSTVADGSTAGDGRSGPSGDDAATDPAPSASDSGDSSDSPGAETRTQPQDTPGDVEPAPPTTSRQAGSGVSTSGTAAGAVSAVAAGEATGAGDGAQSTRAAGTTQAEQSDGTDPLWRQVRRALGSLRNLPTGEQQLTIRLRPDDLGSVVVRISTGDAGTTVALVAESATAANQLNQQRQQLISELQDGGLRGVSVDVGTGDDAGRSEGDEAEADVEQSGVDGTVSAAGRVNADGELLRSYRGRPGRGSSEGLIDVDL